VKPPFELEELLKEDELKFHIKSAVNVLRCLTEYYKDRLNPEVYESLINFYSLSESERAEYKTKLRLERGIKKAHQRRQRKLLDEIAFCESRLKSQNAQQNEEFRGRFQARLEQAKRELEDETRKTQDEQRTSEQGEPLESHKSGRIPRKKT
jgi:hypothetical protein